MQYVEYAYDKNHSLFIWSSNLIEHLVFLFANLSKPSFDQSSLFHSQNLTELHLNHSMCTYMIIQHFECLCPPDFLN